MSGKHWSTEEDNKLRELVATKKYSYGQISKFLPGRTGVGCMRRAMNYLNLSHDDFIFKKHSYNQNFFSVPNPINCYVAGYWAADGHVIDSISTKVVAIELSQLEWHQLEKFKQLMEYSGEVKDSSYPYHPEMCALRFYSAYQLAADLEKNFGITPHKTYRLPAPNLTDPNLQLCYLAGLLDGDGCVHINNQDRLSIHYTSSSLNLVKWVQEFICSLELSTMRDGREAEIKDLRPRANAYHYQVCGLKAMCLVRRVQALKSQGIPILDRKWDNERLNNFIHLFETKHEVKAL